MVVLGVLDGVLRGVPKFIAGVRGRLREERCVVERGVVVVPIRPLLGVANLVVVFVAVVIVNVVAAVAGCLLLVNR